MNRYTFVCTHTWKYACIQILHACIHTCVYIYICMHACIHTYIHTCMHTYMHTVRADPGLKFVGRWWLRYLCYMCVSALVCMYMNQVSMVYACVSACIYIRMYQLYGVCMYERLYIHVCVCMYVCVCV